MKYLRILLKLSGEALLGSGTYGIDPQRLNDYAMEIKALADYEVQVGIVIGGGNIYRGVSGSGEGMDRVQGDYMGMLATVINSMALQSELEKVGVSTTHVSGLPIDGISAKMTRRKAIEEMEAGKVVLISGGTGNPFFTTDTAAALRAIEIGAEAILKGTRVDGIYTADPEKDPKATRFDTITFDQAYQMNLKIMDLTAFTLCKENNMPLIVFDMNKKGNLVKLVKGENIGTIVTV